MSKENKKTFKLEIGGKDLVVEIRDLASNTNGSCLVRYGDTMILATAVMSKGSAKAQDFFPLTVEYEERFYAAGKILGPRFIKREGRPTDEAIITARLIDRAIRPRFPKNLGREVQVVITTLSWDSQNDPDVLGLVAAFNALNISDIPWQGDMASARIGRIGEKFLINPTYEERVKSQFDFIVSAVKEGNELLLNMIEMEGSEANEDIVFEAFEFAEPYLKKVVEFLGQIKKEIGKEKIALAPPAKDPDLEKEIKEFLGSKLEETLYPKDKSLKTDGIGALKEELALYIEEKYPGSGKNKYAQDFFEKETDRLVHEKAIKEEKRPDGRKLDQVRELNCEAGILPRTHGSGLFMRGETKSLSILTLGAPGDQRLVEGMEMSGKKRFMHHYNFPPYSSGEIKPMRGPGRREIGHGMLAEKALMPLIPTFEKFPYTIRIVSEILSSNGSTSMASVCGSSLALMDAGVPIKAPAAGIAIGLMSDERKNYKILTDIQGPEDHHGDMDFKVAGTKEGVTAIQMDVKVHGITKEIFKEAMKRAKEARLQILEKITGVLANPRPELSPYAPRIITIQINPDKIREVIGPGGKMINEIIDTCGVEIDIQDSGLIFVTAEKEEAAKKAVAWIENITREIKIGEVFEGKVKRILPFGAFVEIAPGQEGLVHISQLSKNRVNKVEDVVKIGDIVSVKVIEIDEIGRINLSMKDIK
ncbi:MAG: polyribonucleotide nucleotidyltransferase [Candidatus Nealsonbacteria bacterium]|nr:polyribonucleotide nucleotidyltransferase [Candidatus Nealsonbacteria bacterium]